MIDKISKTIISTPVPTNPTNVIVKAVEIVKTILEVINKDLEKKADEIIEDIRKM